MLDAYKELTPVIYGEHAIKYLFCKGEQGDLCFNMHWHDRMELLRIVSGRLELHLGAEHYSVFPGQLVIIGPRRMHYGFAGESGVIYHTIMFDIEKFYNATLAADKYLVPVNKNITNFQAVATSRQVIDVVDKLVNLLTTEKGENPLLAIGAVYEILGLLHQHCRSDTKVIPNADDKFRPILEYMNHNFAEKISAKEICTRFGYNETYFCRRFKAITGITVMHYILILRMEKAQKLLRGSDEDVGNIAWQCGFSDISYFSNCFKKHFGITPTEFRKKEE